MRLCYLFFIALLGFSNAITHLTAMQYLPRNKNYLSYQITDNVTSRGSLYLDHMEVCNQVSVTGSLTAECSKIGSVSVSGCVFLHNSSVDGDFFVNGKAKVCNSVIEGDTCVIGVLEAYDSKFEENIQITASYLELNGSQAPGIFVQKCNPCHDLQVVKLSRGSCIDGDIVFESGNGRVILDRCSSIKGDIQGGMITYPGNCSNY